MARVIVGSYLFRFPLGGYMSWVIQWLIGLRRLGHDVYVFERSGYSGSCYDPAAGLHGDDCAYGLRVVGQLLIDFGFEDRWCYHAADDTYYGLSRGRVAEAFKTADLFVDMGAHGAWEPESMLAARTVLVDGEPGRTQIRRARRLALGDRVPVYDRYFTVGLNVGASTCTVPTCGIEWLPIVDPVDVALFPVRSLPAGAAYTTVMSWRAHEALEHLGNVYGQKDRSFNRFMDLPSRIVHPLEMAVAGQGTPRDQLVAAGWRLRDAEETTVSFDSWRQYIANSRGEFGVCKEIFVAMNTGWFSDRSAVYLASGRPVVLQDTGFSDHLPCGLGLFAVQSVDEAASAIEAIERCYEQQARAARELAVEYFDTRKVLSRFLASAGL